MTNEIDVTGFTNEEVNIIFEKMDNLNIDYMKIQKIITILSEIDIKTYRYLIDFSRT